MVKKRMTRLLMIATGLVMLCLVCGCDRNGKPSSGYLNEAERLFADRDYGRAADGYMKAANDDPGAVAAWSGLARARLKLGDVRGATEAYQKVLTIDPGHIPALLCLARFELLAGHTAAAEAGIERALKNSPENSEALLLLADVYQRTNRLVPAAGVYERILTMTPGMTAALIGLARLQAQQGDLAAARESLEKAAANAPEAVEPRLLLFNFYHGQGDDRNAERVLLGLIAANPGNPEMRILIGRYYFSRGRIDDAEKAFLEAVDLAPDQPTAYLMAGRFYNAVKKPDAALDMFRKAARLRPRDMKIKALLAEFYLANGDLEAAGQTIDGVLDDHPGYFPARLLQVRTLLAEKAYDAAIALCDAYLKSNPASDQLLMFKGMAYVGNGALPLAEEAFSGAVRMAPANITAKFKLLEVYLNSGRIDKAQVLYRDIFGYLNKNFDVTMILGNTELYMEKSQKGLDSLASLSRFASANPFEHFRAEHRDRFQAEYDRLMNEFQRLLDQRPDLVEIFENIILLHVVRNEYDLALEKCDQQITRFEKNSLLAAKVYNIKGGLYLAQNDIDQAETAFKQAIQLAPEVLKPYYGLAKIYLIKQNLDGAIAQYKALRERDPDQPVPCLLLGVMYKMKGELKTAEDYYRQALALNPDFLPAINNLAYLLAEQGKDLDEALRLARHANDLQPDDPYVLDTLGWVYYQRGLYPDAVRELRSSVSQLPASAVANYHLGMAYYKSGDNRLAGEYLERALQAGEEFSGAREARRILLQLY